MSLVSRIVLAIVCLASIQASAQQKLDVTLRHDSVFLKNEFQFRAVMKETKGYKLIQLRSQKDSILGLLMVFPKDTNLLFDARFPRINKMYDCLYPKMEMLTLYESYVRNEVIVNGELSEIGLTEYCKARNVPLTAIPIRKVARPNVATQDSILKANAELKMKTRVDITVTNSSAKVLNISSGRVVKTIDSKRTYAEKRQDSIPAGESKVIIAFDGEFICIVAEDNSEKDCLLVKHELKALTISSEGEHFKK